MIKRQSPLNIMQLISVLTLVLFLSGMTAAQGSPPAGGGPAGQQMPASGAEDATSLAKQTQNPVSSLISVPFQSNWNYGVGSDRRTQYLLNIQPAIPMKLTEDFNLIARLILPVTHLPLGAFDSQFGTGDATLSFFFSPRKPSKVIWGTGPIFLLPTASDAVLGSGKWGAGPTAVVVTMPGHWVMGALVSNVWSFAGDSSRPPVNTFLFQPFLNYNVPKAKGLALTSSPIITANWRAPNDQRWVVPLGGGASQTFVAGKQAMSVGFQMFYNVERPDNAANWNWRFTFSLLFPKK